MKRRPTVSVFAQSLFILFLAWSVNPSASAAEMTINFTGLVKSLTGNMTGYFAIDEVAPTSQFTFSTDEGQASFADTAGFASSTYRYDSLYQFSGLPYGITLSYPALTGSSWYTGPSTGQGTAPDSTFTSDNNIEVRVANDRVIDQAASTAFAGLVTPGTYDWIDLRWTANGLAYDQSINLQTWQLSIIGDAGWFSDGKLIPDALPTTFSLLMYAGYDSDATYSPSYHIGDMLAIPNSYSVGPAVSAVPVPPAVWLLASGLAGLGLTARRRNPTPIS
ncbi:MAG: hypothetical protein GC138_01220 [Gammaproteobacteria bacterium]|nr:hypothetical protein [Gammaproteobacteria bacterium]